MCKNISRNNLSYLLVIHFCFTFVNRFLRFCLSLEYHEENVTQNEVNNTCWDRQTHGETFPITNLCVGDPRSSPFQFETEAVYTNQLRNRLTIWEF